MASKNEQKTIEIKNPTFVGISCPECGSKNYKILGTGSLGSSVGKQLLFGGVGNMAASSASKNDFELKPVKFQCNDCKKKFESKPGISGNPTNNRNPGEGERRLTAGRRDPAPRRLPAASPQPQQHQQQSQQSVS